MTLKSRPLHSYRIVDQASKAGTCILKTPKSLNWRLSAFIDLNHLLAELSISGFNLACTCVSDHVTYGVSMNLPLVRDVMGTHGTKDRIRSRG